MNVRLSNPLTLSLVIPVYNEEHHINSCLKAVARQTIVPLEVIVVDNNCSDRTIEIAEKFPFVRVVHEKRQGRTYARNAGFSEAKGDIVGRIDADSIIDTHWVENTLSHFSEDKELSGLTGMGYSSPGPFIHKPKTTIWTRIYYWYVRSSFRTPTMWGATMAIRRQVWSLVKNELATDDDTVHEDQDLSLCMAALGMKIQEFADVKVVIDGQTYRYLPKFWRYWRMQRSTLKLHKQKGTFKSSKFPRLGVWQVTPGFIIATLITVPLFTVVTLILFPIDWVMIQLLGADEWLGNADN